MTRPSSAVQRGEELELAQGVGDDSGMGAPRVAIHNAIATFATQRRHAMWAGRPAHSPEVRAGVPFLRSSETINALVLCHYTLSRIVALMLPARSPVVSALRRLRDEAQLFQMQLADLAGVRQATVSAIETGRSKMIALSVLDRLCEALSD